MQQTPELSRFIRDALSRGRSRADIRNSLSAAEWTPLEIDTALAGWMFSDETGPVPRPQRSTSAWDALFYTLLFAAFGMMIGHALHLMLGVITMLLPEPGDSYSRWRMNGLRWSMAAVIVFTPAFLWLHARDAAAVRANPVRTFGTIRRWLTAIAILAAVLTLASDAIYVIYAFLTGELTRQFVVKCGAVAVMATVVLAYFRQERQTDTPARFSPAALLAAGLTLLTLIASLWLSGGPQQGRAETRDQTRLKELRTLKADVAGCQSLPRGDQAQDVNPLDCARAPQHLSAMAGSITYHPLANDRFELCTRLESPDRAGSRYNIYRKGDLHCIEGKRR